MPPGRLSSEVLRARPTSRAPPGRPRTHWRSLLAREREVWASLLRLLLPQPNSIRSGEWMDGTSTCLTQPDITGQFVKDVKKKTSQYNYFDISEDRRLQCSTETTILLN